jgi:hypothetical protein
MLSIQWDKKIIIIYKIQKINTSTSSVKMYKNMNSVYTKPEDLTFTIIKTLIQ